MEAAGAIELFNEQRNPDDRLPPYDENGTPPEWLATVMGAFPKMKKRKDIVCCHLTACRLRMQWVV